jgi:hypothetical protein
VKEKITITVSLALFSLLLAFVASNWLYSGTGQEAKAFWAMSAVLFTVLNTLVWGNSKGRNHAR